MSRVHTGTSGWTYDGWRGPFGARMARADAGQFRVRLEGVEIHRARPASGAWRAPNPKSAQKSLEKCRCSAPNMVPIR
jgi:hypothetical protein